MSTCPWQVTQPMPLFTWMPWLKYEIRQIVDARPLEGPFRRENWRDWLQNGRVAPDLRMAVHARLGGGDVGEGGFLDRRVAIAAIESHAADVMGVAELDRLFDEIALLRWDAR